jgi:N-acetylmuramoyl-L-alanine amidase
MSKPWVPYVVQQGDHVKKLAFVHGVDAKAVWEHPANKELASRRKNMDVLCAGDVLHLPECPLDALTLSAGTSNRYRAKVPTIDVTLLFRDVDRSPLAGKRYVVEGIGTVDGTDRSTDADGRVTFSAPVTTREATIVFPDLGLSFAVGLGDLDPADERSGVRQRLQNLGFLPHGTSAASDPDDTMFTAALKSFQLSARLPVSGLVDPATLDALEEEHHL